MGQVFSGVLDGKGRRFAIVVSRFNETITSRLLEGAIDCLVRHGVKKEEVTVAWVPGSFEVPAVAARLVRAREFDAVICLGAVIRGGTPHFDYVAGQSSREVSRLAMESEIPVIYGILTCDTVEQAVDRAGAKTGNRGWQASLSALEMVNLYESFQ